MRAVSALSCFVPVLTSAISLTDTELDVWKMKVKNFMPFQVFHDPYELCKSTAPIISRYSRNLEMGQCKFIVSAYS